MNASESPVGRGLLGPLPERWRPFSAMLAGLIILAALAVFGRYGGDAWRFFVGYTIAAAVFGAGWTLYLSRNHRSHA